MYTFANYNSKCSNIKHRSGISEEATSTTTSAVAITTCEMGVGVPVKWVLEYLTDMVPKEMYVGVGEVERAERVMVRRSIQPFGREVTRIWKFWKSMEGRAWLERATAWQRELL